MDLFQHRYYRINKILMTLIGQWPYQSTRARRGFVIAFLSLSGIQLPPLLMALVKYRDDRNILLDGVLALLLSAFSMTKFIGVMGNSKKTLSLVNRIRMGWHVWAGEREVKFLHEYAEQGRRITFAYLAMNVFSQFVFLAQPFVLKIIDRFLKNGTEPGIFPYPVDFHHLNVQKYYFYIFVYLYVTASTISVCLAASDIMLICYVQHACGIFAALGHKLKSLGNNRTSVKRGETRHVLDKRDVVLITSCIDRHDEAIEYVNLIAASYSWNLFFTIGFGVIIFNIVGLQILMKTNHPESIIRYVVFALSGTMYFCIESYVSETVIDHSISILFCIYSTKWYKLSLKAQSLLRFMMMRCSVPCQLTAGNMLVMSMRNFWLTSKTTLSYLMFLRSMQRS